MDYYAGLDVSLEETSVCVVDGDGAVVHEARVATAVEAIAETLRRFARSLARVALDALALAPWRPARGRFCGDLHRDQAPQGLVGGDAQQRNDARGIAQMMRLGWVRMVHVKSPESHAFRLLLTNRKTLQRKALDIENEIRGTLKAFGLKVGNPSVHPHLLRGYECRASCAL